MGHLLLCGEKHEGEAGEHKPSPPAEGESLVCVTDTVSPSTKCVLVQLRLALDTVVTRGICAWGGWGGRGALPRNAKQINGVDKITALHCPWAGEIHRGLMFSGKLHVQCINRSNISHLGFPCTALVSARN